MGKRSARDRKRMLDNGIGNLHSVSDTGPTVLMMMLYACVDMYIQYLNARDMCKDMCDGDTCMRDVYGQRVRGAVRVMAVGRTPETQRDVLARVKRMAVAKRDGVSGWELM